MDQYHQGVFVNTRNRIKLDNDAIKIKNCLKAAHYAKYEKAYDLLKVHAEFYKGDPEDRSEIADALMQVGSALLTKKKVEEACLAYFKAYQMDPDNDIVENLSFYLGCNDPKSEKEVEEKVEAALEEERRQNRRRTYK